jgi:hypothetical protein
MTILEQINSEAVSELQNQPHGRTGANIPSNATSPIQ